MPLCMDPNETFEISLARDVAKAERTTFRFRYLSSRAFRRHWKVIENLRTYFQTPVETRKYQDLDALMTEVYGCLRSQLAGWSNLGEFKPEDLDAVLSDPEARELLSESLRMSELSVPEKNASESQSPTPGAGPATVPAAQESATTGPQT